MVTRRDLQPAFPNTSLCVNAMWSSFYSFDEYYVDPDLGTPTPTLDAGISPKGACVVCVHVPRFASF